MNETSTNIPDTTAAPTLYMPVFQSNKRVYSVDEIQDILGIGLSTVYKLVKSGQFHTVRVGHRVLVSKKSFDEWLQP